jgi:hypothetical protein
MELYYKYQPVTWYIGVIEAAPDAVADVIQPLYMPDDTLRGIFHKKECIDNVLSEFEPLGPGNKFLLVETKNGWATLFCNAFYDSVGMPASYAADKLCVSHYVVCNVPTTISHDQRSGAYGARKLEFRTANNPITEEPVFGVHLINDAGRWCFYRYGKKQPFENERAYRSFRKTDRFTANMLATYCMELGIPVYDRNWYSDNAIVIEQKLGPDEHGISYEEAREKLRIDQIAGAK